MSQIPEPIDLNGYHDYSEHEHEHQLLIELIKRFNELVIYLDSISERL